MKTPPILFVVFNRPEPTKRVFEAIRQRKPEKLYITADGPREHKEGEAERCEAVRAIFKNIDWECEVKTLFRDKNLGCKLGVSGAINWFFENEEEGIILEDDCLPDQSFFDFTKELLERYRDDERIMIISGDNFQYGIKRGSASYYFSRHPHIWGWATWRRAWAKYDIEMKTYDKFIKDDMINAIFTNSKIANLNLTKYNQVYSDGLDTWDIQWDYTILINNGLCIIPNKNLVKNIGFDSDATHTTNENNAFDIYKNMQAESIGEIIHPDFIVRDFRADAYTDLVRDGISSDELADNVIFKRHVKSMINNNRILRTGIKPFNLLRKKLK